MPNFHEYAILLLVISMNNIPLFPSQGGTASLILREIPYSGKAYILFQTVIPENLEPMISECTAFCRACGAETCFVTRKDSSDSLPLPHSHDILLLSTDKSRLPQGSPIRLVPIQEDNDSIYINLYNRCFDSVSGAAFYDRGQIRRIYLLHQKAFLALMENGTPFGFGELHENELAAVGVLPEYRGRGYDLTLALLQHCPGPEITLSVASDNSAALKLYGKLGFIQKELLSRWHIG